MDQENAMADRQVTRTRKDADGDITALCNPGSAWSPRFKADAISDIDSGGHTYFVQTPGTKRAEIRVVNGATGKYLRTEPDSATGNNLDELPDC
jgi:hypothetical protein